MRSIPLLTATFLLLVPLPSLSGADRARPNIVLMYIDNLGYGDLGCYGNREIKSPRVDQLAREGVRCTDFYVVSPGCTPSRGALLTGRYPLRNGLVHQLVTSENWTGIGLPHRERILPQYLKQAGYVTACFGKWNIGFAPGSRPTERGFDEFLGFRSGNIHYFKHTYHGEYDMFRGIERHVVEGYSTDIFADAACDFIRRKVDQPFFLYVPFNAPHYVSSVNTSPGEQPEWHVPGKYLERYGWPADDKTEKHRYLALLTALDEAVGRVLDTLDETGLRDNTLVMFISDMGAILRPTHGLGVASNAPFRDGAPSMYEGGVRVPAIFRWPGRIKAGSVSREMLSNLDVLPLCLAAAGLSPPEDRVLDGYDPMPALTGTTKSPYNRLVFQYGAASGLRIGNLKLVRSRAEKPWELYDVAGDPAESKNLASEHPADVARLDAEFQNWLAEVKRDASEPAPRVQANQQQSRVPANREAFYLFLLVGQSNMAGRGQVEKEDQVAHPRVLMLNKAGEWAPAIDPLHFDKSNVGVGIGKTFGAVIAEANPKITVGLIPCAVGGSPIDSWKPGQFHSPTSSHPWDDAIRRAKLALKSGVLKGILWHQGEAEQTPELAAAYERKLHDLIARFRKELNAPDVPFIAGQMGQFSERPWSDAKKTVDAAHRSLPEEVAGTAFVSSDGLSHKGDEVHFDSKSYREFGRRYANAWLALTRGEGTKQKPQTSGSAATDRDGHTDEVSKEEDYSAELPKIPPKSPEESRKAIQLKAGFHAELVASEPLVRSPMAMDFDEFGRAFVVELPEYNQYASPKPHGEGAIKLLQDIDGDGRFDKATVYVADLDYPTAVACWDGGVLVGVAPDILFCKDTDGDGKADVRQRLFTGFGQDKAGEGMLNSFRWRIDNRFHVPTGLDGGDVVPVHGQNRGEHAGPPATEQNSTEKTAIAPINVRGQHLLLEPRTMTLTATSGGGQHGMSLDDWNLHCFVCGNSEPVHLVMYDGRYLARNPYLKAPAAAVNIAPGGKFTRLMRASAVEPWRMLRTRLRSAGVIPGSDEGGTPSGFFTGATGITVYRGDAWPAEFCGNVFVGEVANNLVYRARLEPSGVGLTAHRADPDAEFLASSDNWFRPVQFANAPDGTLYVLDMYRQLIEGAAFLAPQILKHMDPSAGADKGRIYRIAPDGFRFRPAPPLGDLPTPELVKFYEHPNAWHRETASRLVYQRQDRATIVPLQGLAASSKSPLARAMALYSLQGLSALDPVLVVSALRADQPQVRQHALRLAEAFVDQVEIRDAALASADDDDVRVRYQAAFTLGAFSGESATRALGRLAVRDGADSWMQLAILSSLGSRRGEFLSALLSDRSARSQAHVKTMLNAVASQIGAANSRADLAMMIQQLDVLASDPDDKRLAEELVRSLVSTQAAAKELLAGATGGKAREILAALIQDAIATARDGAKPPKDRATAVWTLASSALVDTKDLFAELLQSNQPQPVQTAALETLARFDAADVPALILEAWPSQTPQLRATSVETLFSRPQWINAFLDAVERQTIAQADLDPARIELLKKHADAGIRARATALFTGTTLARRQEVVDAYQKSLELKGDVDQGRMHFRKTCAACHKLEDYGESIGADLNAIRDRGTEAVMLNILDPNREVKPQFHSYVVLLNSGRTLSGMITAETATSLNVRKADNTTETVLRVDIEELKSTGISFMPEGLEKELDIAAMADLLAYLNSIK